MRLLALLLLIGSTPHKQAWNLTVWQDERRPECVYYADGRDSVPGTATCTPFCVEFATGPMVGTGKRRATILSLGDCDAACRAPAVEIAGLREVPCSVPQS